MTWVTALPGAAVLALLWVVPGTMLLRLLGVRGLASLGGGPAATAALVGVLAMAYDRAGFGWSLPTFAGGAAAVLGAAALARRAGPLPGGLTPVPPLGRTVSLLLLLSLTVGGVLVAGPVMAGIGQPDQPEQAWDAVFHLNATALIRETGNASLIGSLEPMYGGSAGYYPTVWHAVAAIAPGVDVSVAANVQNLILGAVVWPAGLAALTRVAVRAPAATVLVPLLASALVVFPTVVLTVLAPWPHGLSVAILPGAIAVLLVALGVPWQRAPRSAAPLAAAVVTAGVTLAHGSGAFSLLVLAGPSVAVVLSRHGREWWHAGRPRAVAAGTAAVVVVVALAGVLLWELPALRSTLDFSRTGSASYVPTLARLVADVPLVLDLGAGGFTAVPITVLGVAGAVLAVRRRRARWLVLAWALTATLTLLAAGPEWNPLRALAGPWYTQAGRIAALAAIPTLVLSSAALAALGEWLAERGAPRAAVVRTSTRAARTMLPRPTTPAAVPRAAVLTAALAAVVVAVSGSRWGLREDVTAVAYRPDRIAWGTMLTDSEITMQRRLAEVLPPTAIVLGDPFNGSAYLPALAGVDVVHRQLGPVRGDDHAVLLGPVVGLRTDRVCEATARLGVTHLYTDTARAVDGAKVHTRGSGLRRIDPREAGLELVDAGGTAAVWRLPAC